MSAVTFRKISGTNVYAGTHADLGDERTLYLGGDAKNPATYLSVVVPGPGGKGWMDAARSWRTFRTLAEAAESIRKNKQR